MGHDTTMDISTTTAREETLARVDHTAGSTADIDPLRTVEAPYIRDPRIDEQARELRIKTTLRAALFAWGCLFLGLGAVDATFDAFPSPEYFLVATGVTLATIAITGKEPKAEDREDGK